MNVHQAIVQLQRMADPKTGWNEVLGTEAQESIRAVLTVNRDLLEACKAVAYEADRKDGFDYLVHQTRFELVLKAIAKAAEGMGVGVTA